MFGFHVMMVANDAGATYIEDGQIKLKTFNLTLSSKVAAIFC